MSFCHLLKNRLHITIIKRSIRLDFCHCIVNWDIVSQDYTHHIEKGNNSISFLNLQPYGFPFKLTHYLRGFIIFTFPALFSLIVNVALFSLLPYIVLHKIHLVSQGYFNLHS